LNASTAAGTVVYAIGDIHGRFDLLQALMAEIEADAARRPVAHRSFLRLIEASHRCGDHFFAHAGVRPGVPLDRQAARDLMWIRSQFLDSTLDHGAVVVHGHSIAERPQLRPNRIGIDTGAYRSGILTCLVLDGRSRHFLHTG